MRLLEFLFKCALLFFVYLFLSNFFVDTKFKDILQVLKPTNAIQLPVNQPDNAQIEAKIDLAKQSIELAKQIALFELQQGCKQAIEIRLQRMDEKSGLKAEANENKGNAAPDLKYSYDTVFVYASDNKQFTDYKKQILNYNSKLTVIKK